MKMARPALGTLFQVVDSIYAIHSSLSNSSVHISREAIDSKISAAAARRESLVKETKAKLAAHEEHAKQVRKRKAEHPQE